MIFWDGDLLTLTPAYDICPQGRTGNEASQAMQIFGSNNRSQVNSCIEAANHFLLSEQVARAIIEDLTATIEQKWDAVCDEAEVNEVEKRYFWGRQFLNPYSVSFL